MSKMENYTVIDIIKLYRKIVGNDIEKVLYTVFLDEDSRNLKMKIDRIANEKGLSISDKKTYLRTRANIVYDEIIKLFLNNANKNNNKKVKQILVSEVYRRYSDRMTSKEEKNAKEFILDGKEYGTYIYPSDKYKGLKERFIITKEKQEKVKSIHNEDFREIVEDSVRSSVETNEILSLFKIQYGSAVYSAILEGIYIKLFLDNNRMNVMEFKENLAKGKIGEIIIQDERLTIEFKEMLTEYFFNNLQFIDKESLLLNAAARVILGLKIYKGEKIEGITLNSQKEDASEEVSIDFLRILSKVLKQQNYNANYSIISDNGEKVISVNKDYLEQFLSRCTKKRYITDEEIEKIHNDITEGYLTEDLEKRRIAKIDIQDLINASKSYDSKIEQEEKDRVLNCAIEVAEYLKQSEKITDRQLLDMYLDGDINFELISSVDINEFTEENYFSELKNLYIGMAYLANTDKEKLAFERLSRFSKLYKKLNESGKVSIDEDEVAGGIIEFFDIENAPDILSDLYGLEIVGLEKAIDWGGADVLLQEYKKGRLKPQEVRKFFEQDKVNNFNIIAKVISKIPDNGERFMVIGSIFPEETEEDRKTREILLDECIRVSSGIKNNSAGGNRKNGQGKAKKYCNHITDPFARISLIKALDDNYSFEMTADGHAIVKLPTFGEVIIEKMLNNNRQPSHEAATFIMDEKYYNQNKFRIYKNQRIDRKEIGKEVANKNVARIIHSVATWGADIKEHFKKSGKVKWSKRQEDEIDEAIKRVKRSDLINIDNQQLAKMILNLVVTRKATIDQVKQIAAIYGVDLDKVMNSLDDSYTK